MKSFFKTPHLLASPMALSLALSMTLGATPTYASHGDTQNHWGKSFIDTAISAGLMSGLSTTVFSPDTSMTGGQFAVVICNGFFQGETLSKSTDVHWYDMYVNQLEANGLLQDSEGNALVSFSSSSKGGDDISRGDVACIIARILEKQGLSDTTSSEVLNSLTDLNTTGISSGVKQDIISVVNHHIMHGSDSKFLPHDSMTRASVCVVVQVMLEQQLIEGKPVTEESKPTTSEALYTGNYFKADYSTIFSDGNFIYEHVKMFDFDYHNGMVSANGKKDYASHALENYDSFSYTIDRQLINDALTHLDFDTLNMISLLVTGELQDYFHQVTDQFFMTLMSGHKICFYEQNYDYLLQLYQGLAFVNQDSYPNNTLKRVYTLLQGWTQEILSLDQLEEYYSLRSHFQEEKIIELDMSDPAGFLSYSASENGYYSILNKV